MCIYAATAQLYRIYPISFFIFNFVDQLGSNFNPIDRIASLSLFSLNIFVLSSSTCFLPWSITLQLGEACFFSQLKSSIWSKQLVDVCFNIVIIVNSLPSFFVSQEQHTLTLTSLHSHTWMLSESSIIGRLVTCNSISTVWASCIRNYPGLSHMSIQLWLFLLSLTTWWHPANSTEFLKPYIKTDPSIVPQYTTQFLTFLMCTAEIWTSSSFNITTQFSRLEIRISILLSFLNVLFASFSVKTAFCLPLKSTVASDRMSSSVAGVLAKAGVESTVASVVAGFFLRDLNENLALGVSSALVRSNISLSSFIC